MTAPARSAFRLPLTARLRRSLSCVRSRPHRGARKRADIVQFRVSKTQSIG
jgi:hypothetical protein